MFKIIFSCFFFFCFSFGFSGEIRQGTLQNGMRYYLCPDNTQENSSEDFSLFEGYDSITFVIKQPENFVLFPTLKLFEDRDFFEYIGSQEGPRGSTKQDGFSNSSMSFSWKQNNWENLPNFAEFFHLESISDLVIHKLQKKYWRNRDDLELEFYLLARHIYGCDFEETNSLFSEDMAMIKKVCQSLFDPSQMAVILSGNFNSEELEKNLEDLFGDILGNGISNPPLTFKPEGPVVFSYEWSQYDNDDDEDDDDEILAEEIQSIKSYFYFYAYEPTYKNHVLNDLLFYMKLDISNGFCGSFSIGNLNPVAQFYSPEKISLSRFDEVLFHKAKGKLGKAYRNQNASKAGQCTNHFLSDIPDALESDHQNLLRELELVNFEDLCSFIEKHIASATELEEKDL